MNNRLVQLLPTSNPRTFVTFLGAAIFLVVGIVSIGVALQWCIPQWRFAARASQTVGVIEQLDTSRSVRPIVAYTVDATRYKVKGRVGTSVPGVYRVGQEVPVSYDPENPQVAEIDGFLERKSLPLTFGGVSIFLVAGACLVLVLVWRGTKAQQSGQPEPPMTSVVKP
jgi:hypothetical protein